ncbi:DUF4112 domain-containing protein [Propylenella binzhouense]|uniref:DUF4112 domain-containing protein n=1 Tax=Propylenella binzhouense TaxID=2555902 RepID=A0A964WS15_9HYPH|nr:DUF4112 domain-containing protein [Propylenella binzhouense]MYZ46386.1 DUF4112 domain-containing protein [Propylenella binzhouense]
MTAIDASSPSRSGPATGFAGRYVADDETTRRMRRLDNLERWLDRQFYVPGIRMPVGVDGIVGLLPVVGDTATAALSAYIVWEAHKAGADGSVKARMLGNIALDYLIGLVPVIGWVGDFFHKANTKNVRLLKRHLAERGRLAGPAEL